MKGEQTQTPSVPPLRIHHLMMWMTAAAILIAGSMGFDRTMRNGPPIENPLIIASLILGAIAITGAATFTLLGISWSDRGYPFPCNPGEWLLWMIAHMTALFIAAYVGIFVAFFISHDLVNAYYLVMGLWIFYYWTRSCARGMSRYSDSKAWRVTFGLLMLTSIACIVVQSALPMLLFLACLLWATVDDLNRRVRRGWLHWFGVTLALAVACALIGAFDAPKIFR